MAQTGVDTTSLCGTSEFFSFCQACPLCCSFVTVWKFQIIAKTTLEAADMQVSEVEADASTQVFTRLQLDHKTGVLSLEASRVWRLRSGLEHASRSSAPSLNHTCRVICLISLASFTIPVCRWIASETDPADEPPHSKRYRPRMHSDVDQCETSATRFNPSPRAVYRSLCPNHTMQTQVKGGQIHIRKRREEEGRVRHFILGESFFLEQNRAAATTVLCYAITPNEFLAC